MVFIFGETPLSAFSKAEILASAIINPEEILIANVDLAHTKTVKFIRPYLRDRQVDANQNLSHRFIDTPKEKGDS